MKRPMTGADGQNNYKNQKVVALSCFVGVAVAFLLLSLFAFIMSVKDLPHGAITPIAIAAVVAGCFAAGYFAGQQLREQGLLYGLICGAILFAVAFLCELMLIGGGFSVLLFYKFIIYISSGMIGGVFGVNKRRKVRPSPGRKK